MPVPIKPANGTLSVWQRKDGRKDEFLGEKLRAELEAQASDVRQRRERYVTLLHVLRKYGGVINAAAATQTIYLMDADANAEVAEAYEVVMLEATSEGLRAALVEARDALGAMIAASLDSRGRIGALHESLEDQLDVLREQMRVELDAQRRLRRRTYLAAVPRRDPGRPGTAIDDPRPVSVFGAHDRESLGCPCLGCVMRRSHR
jgi:hypothetical protein